MKSIHIALVIGALAPVVSTPLPAQSIPGNWKLTFSDEFDGTELDRTKWRVGYHFNAIINNEKQHYIAENVLLDGSGVLRFKAEKRTVTAPGMKTQQPYASGSIETWDLFSQKYGLFEARMRMPSAKGLWVAFWLMPDRGRESGDQKRMSTYDGGMEFDILEYLPVWGDYFHTAMIWDGYGKKKQARAGGGGSHSPRHKVDGINEDFHTFSLYWEEGRAMFLVDGRVVDGWFNGRVASVPMHVILGCAIGGQWPETYGPVDDAALPDHVEVDWVRVYSGKVASNFKIPDFDNFPYGPGGSPLELPGTIEAEHFNYGKKDVAWHDSDDASHGSFRKHRGPDVEPTHVTGTADGEWLKYTVRIPKAGLYRFTARGRSAGPVSVKVSVNDQPAPLVVFTRDWGTEWTEETKVGIALPAGDHVLKITFTGSMDLDAIIVATSR